jgi:hypothetical protein
MKKLIQILLFVAFASSSSAHAFGLNSINVSTGFGGYPSCSLGFTFGQPTYSPMFCCQPVYGCQFMPYYAPPVQPMGKIGTIICASLFAVAFGLSIFNLLVNI